MRLALIAGLGVAVAAGCQSAPAPAAPPAPTPEVDGGPTFTPMSRPLGELVYVTNQDGASVTVIDAETHRVVETVDLRALGFSATAKPHHVVADPDGRHWYVSLIGENTVLKMDAATNRVVARGAFEVPGMLAYDLETDRLFVGRSMSAVNPPQRIGVIDRDDMSVEEIAVLFPRPHALAANPRSVHAYSASLADNRMATVDPAEEDVRIQTFMEGMDHADHAAMGHDQGEMIHTLVDFAVSPDGTTLVGTGEMSGKLLVFSLADPGQPRLTRELDIGPRPWHPVFSPDGGEVWVPSKANNTVTVVRAGDWTVERVIQGNGLAEPHGLAFSADGRWAFVSNSDTRNEYPGEGGTVVIIETATNRIVKVLAAGQNATGIGTRARP